MLNLNNFVTDEVRRVTEVNLTTDLVNWTARKVESPTWEFTGETVEKTDNKGAKLAIFDTAKGVTFSGELSMFTVPLLASQRGASVQYGTESLPVAGEIFEVLKVSGGTATMTHTPTVAPSYVYEITADKNTGDSHEVGTEWAVSGRTITIPESYKGAYVGVHYKFTAKSGTLVKDMADEYSDAAKYIVELYVKDICSEQRRLGYIVFPKAKISNNFSINLTTEGTHPFSIEAIQDYCADENLLCYLLFAEPDAEEDEE